MTVLSSDNRVVEYLAARVYLSTGALVVENPNFSGHSNIPVEKSYSDVSNDSVNICDYVKSIADHDAALLKGAEQIFTKTDTAIAEDILNAL